MEKLQQNQSENEDIKPLAIRVKHPQWQVRKRAYEEIYAHLQNISTVKEQFGINNEVFSASKLSPILNNIVEQKHPIILSKGLQCVLRILEIKSSMIKYFNKLVVQGLEKLPILTHQKNQILQKFMEILNYLRQQSGLIATLNSKLSLPNQKVVHFIIQVIKELQISALKKKLFQLSKKHPKKDIKDWAAEVASNLADDQESTDFKEQQPVKSTRPTAVKKQVKKDQNKRSLQILDKLHQYDQIDSKNQQKYTEQLLQTINQIALLPNTPQLSNFCYYIQLMIEDNNQIISTNGVKMLTALVKLRSQLIPFSFPLLFIFRKFKMHKTHSTNANLFKLTDQLLCSNRSIDLMNAVSEGMNNVEPKVNLKYGCIMTFIRTFCYFYREPQLFETYCLGEYVEFYDKIENKKQIQKLISKSFQSFKKEKERQYQPIIQKMKQILGITHSVQQKASKTLKHTNIRSESATCLDKQKNNQRTDQHSKTQLIPKGLPSKTSSKTNFDALVTPQGQLNKIMQLVQSEKCNQSNLKKAIQKCLKCTQNAINGQVFDLFYFCQIVESFIDQYQPNQEFDHIVSEFLINYLITISRIKVKEGKKSSKIVQKGVEYLLKISVVKLVLSKQIMTILDNIRDNLGYEVILLSLGNFLVMGGEISKKKNKKYLIRWLEQNTSEQYLNNHYFQLREAIQSNGQKKQKNETKQKIITPCVINLPTFQDLRGNVSKGRLEQKQNKNSTNKTQVAQMIEVKEIVKQDVKMTKEALQNLQISEVNIKQNEDKQNFSLEEAEQLGGREDQSDFQLNFNNEQLVKNQTKQSGTKYYYQPQQQQEEKYQQDSKPLLSNEQNHYNTEPQEPQYKNLYVPESSDEENHQEQNHQQQNEHEEVFQYKYLDQKRILYMLSNSGKSFSHLRTLVLNPFKKQTKKHEFLRELTHLIQNQKIAKPEPYKSLLLLVIVLFGEIKTDKTIIQPLQALYEFMAQHCTNNQFLKNIIGLYHCVIEQTQENQRKFLLTILTKSMNRIMPYVQNPLELLRDFQQFYQIGQLVYFQMYPEEYQQIKEMVEKSESLNEVLVRTYQQEGENLNSIVEGWLESGFKRVIKAKLEQLAEEEEGNE